jgi:hypothetical protein
MKKLQVDHLVGRARVCPTRATRNIGEYRYTVSGSSGRSAVIVCAALNGLVKGPAAL